MRRWPQSWRLRATAEQAIPVNTIANQAKPVRRPMPVAAVTGTEITTSVAICMAVNGTGSTRPTWAPW